MPEIRLSNGMFCLVDGIDYQWLKNFNWHIGRNNTNHISVRTQKSINGKMKTILMHRLILKVTDRKIQVDHINHNSLDNRRVNLRLATNSENTRNARIGKHNTSGYKGVYWLKNMNKWRAKIMLNKKSIHLGCFDNLIDGAIAYNNAALKYFGEFACLNKIGGELSRTL